MLNPLRLLSGYDRLPEFQEQMRLMDVEREDMPLGGCVCVCVCGFFVCIHDMRHDLLVWTCLDTCLDILLLSFV